MGGEGAEDTQKVILACSLALFLVSSLFLFLVSQADIPRPVSELDRSMLGQRVSIVGVVVWQFSRNGVTLGEIDTGRSKVRVFDPTGRRLGGIRFNGTVKEYEGQLELVLDA